MQYRSDIDGLRAIAVLPVIFFHAGFSIFSGGYVGVDIFFVISGFLITTLLIEAIENKSFSIADFYERRARRILPALFVVILVCIPFAWIWMTPDQLHGFSKSLVAVSLFASNILFWRESGYFDTTTEEKPLLHTWSLAVEEQYYLFFPIFLIIVWRFGLKTVTALIFSFAIISLSISEWGWRNAPTANFYLAPSRIWELFAGSLASIFIYKYGMRRNQALSLLGLIMIFSSIFFYDKYIPFPSIYTLLPVTGTVLVILFSSKETLAYRFLSLKLLVFIGLLSYSAYLWHQPLLAFARIKSIESLTVTTSLILVAVTFALAYLSYRFVETPFRKKKLLSTRKRMFTVASFILVLPMSIGLAAYSYQDISELRSENAIVLRSIKVKEAYTNRQAAIRAGICHFNTGGKYKNIDDFLHHWQCYSNDEGLIDSKVLLVGDSHSADKAVAFRQAGVDVVQLGGASCPISPLYVKPETSYCTKILNKAHELAKTGKVESVFLSNRFSTDELSSEYLISAIKFWSETKAQIILWSPMPDFTVPMKEYLAYETVQSRPNKERELLFFSYMNDINLPPNVTVVKTSDLWCPQDRASAECGFVDSKGNILMVDEDHLSITGAKIFGLRALNNLNLSKHLQNSL